MYYALLIICVLAAATFNEAHKILLVFPMSMKSHGILGESIAKLLLTAGHEVTYITPDPISQSHPNLHQTVIAQSKYTRLGKNLEDLQPKSVILGNVLEEYLNVSCLTLRDSNIQKLMEDTSQSFDLVITQWMLNDMYSGFSAVFNCPYIWFFTFHDDYDMMRLIHERPNPTVTTNMRTKNVPPYNFVQRAKELLWVISINSFKYLSYDRLESEAYAKLYGPVLAKRGRALPLYEEVRYNASFLFVNSHFTLRESPVIPQNYKAIGGLHISESLEPLSEELLTTIENSEKGVILFSLGTIIKAENFPSNVKKDLLVFFSKLKYTVLWKIDEQFKDLPPNVRTLSWIPNQSVLAHPRCVLLITHGGMLSLTESVHYGVPMVGVPAFADQEVNIKTAVNRGVARMVTISRNLAHDLKEAIEDVLSNSRYKENMIKLSSLYHDRPVPPSLELVHWVEHVIATRGAPHLRSPELLTSWYQKCYMDLAVLIVLLIVFICLVNKIKFWFKKKMQQKKQMQH